MRIIGILSLVLLSLSSLSVNAQRSGIGFHFGAYDFYGPQTDKYFFTDKYKYDYNEATRVYDSSTSSALLWDPMVRFSYWWEINKSIDLYSSISFASLKYPSDRPDNQYINTKLYDIPGGTSSKLLTQLDVRINLNLLSRQKYWVSPYLTSGITGSYHDIYLGTAVPLGLGLNVKLNRQGNVYFNMESAFKVSASSNEENHLQHSFGFVYWFKPGYKAPKPVVVERPIPPTDSDNDGVIDAIDDCPLIPGKAEFAGCPDSDGDGISDRIDRCPYLAGTAQYQGCPPPDRDGDGFLDGEDRCPDQYSKTNGGCPEISKEITNRIERVAKAIFFQTGKAILRPESIEPLNDLVKILQDNPDYFAEIEGHTDNTGSADRNQQLSQQRADAVLNYLVDKGIAADRLKATGYGPSQPVATNKSKIGRAANRRTVVNVKNYR